MKKIVLVLFILFLTGCSKAYVPYEKIDFTSINIDEKDSDYLCLKNAPFFAYSGVGYAGLIPEELYAFDRLMEKENALDYFHKLESEANNQGKLYALCGLYYLDYDNYAYLMEKYGASEEYVEYMEGCLWQEARINEIIKCEDEDGMPVVRFKDNQDTMDAWYERNAPTEGYLLDFYGGSIPFFAKYCSE